MEIQLKLSSRPNAGLNMLTKKHAYADEGYYELVVVVSRFGGLFLIFCSGYFVFIGIFHFMSPHVKKYVSSRFLAKENVRKAKEASQHYYFCFSLILIFANLISAPSWLCL